MGSRDKGNDSVNDTNHLQVAPPSYREREELTDGMHICDLIWENKVIGEYRVLLQKLFWDYFG